MLLLKLEDIMGQIKIYKEEIILSSHRQFSLWYERIIVACVVIPLFCFAPNEMNYKELKTVKTTTLYYY
jgi:hypothetical protein